MGKTSRIAFSVLLFGAAIGGSAPRTAALAASSEASPAATSDAAITARAHAVLEQLDQKHLDRSLLTDEFNDEMSDEALATIYGVVAGNGPPVEFALGEKLRADTETRYIFRAAWKTSRLLMIFGVDIASNKISALYFRPIFQPPQTP